MPHTWQRFELDLDGTKVSVLERASNKPADHPPILMLHGLIAEGDTFRTLMSGLPSDRRVLALDLPGAGYSSRAAAADVSFAGMAAAVRAAIGRLELSKPVILGHSHGGAVALRLAATEPALLHGLILLCPAHPFSGRERALVNFYLSVPGRLFAHSLPLLPDWLHLQAFRRMPGTRANFDRQQLVPYLHTLRAPGTVTHMLALLGSWHPDMEQLGRDLQKLPLALPTLLLWGEEDMIVPEESAKRLLPYLPNARQINLPGVGHLPNEEAPEECAALICNWLEATKQAQNQSSERKPTSAASHERTAPLMTPSFEPGDSGVPTKK